jgi:hypothetical protein
MVESMDYSRSWDKIEDYTLVEGLNGDTYIQSCIAEVEIPPEEAPDLFDREYTVTVGGRMYDSRDAVGPDGFIELPAQTYTYFIPAAEFEFEPKEEISMEKEIVAEEDFSFEAEDYLGVEGEVTQYLSAGFETNPYEEEANDMLGFQFELEGPKDAIKEGSLVFQYATYTKSDDFNFKPVSIGCSTKIGAPLMTEIFTYEGFTSMSSDSSTVADRTFSQQNSEEKAKKKESYGLVQDVEWYSWFDVDEETRIQPCFAVIEYDGKLDSTNDIFGTYNVTLGTRIYADESDTSPKSLPEQSF